MAPVRDHLQQLWNTIGDVFCSIMCWIVLVLVACFAAGMTLAVLTFAVSKRHLPFFLGLVGIVIMVCSILAGLGLIHYWDAKKLEAVVRPETEMENV